ncbi:fluoride efflux transporter CrcB [Oricola sp.]|uniref:fluoride efflux transporter CrcB n=1 Tax=Oricola sp. TaxID=1979950 RepID=UPI003BACF94A
MLHLLLVATGGALGAAARHLMNTAALRLFGPGFPVGTLAVNVVGSFAMGLLIAVLARRIGGTSNEVRLFLATGFLGGFTTFSAFSLDFALMWERGDHGVGFVYLAASVVLSILALFGGLAIVRVLA